MQDTYILKTIFYRFKWQISLTLSLVIIEAVLGIFYPLLIGVAINDLLKNSHQGLYWLTVLGALSLIIGTVRRFYDTRIYANIYRKTASNMVDTEHKKLRSVSTISARSHLMTEFVEFLENSIPEIVQSIIAIIGISIIIAMLNIQVFFACLALLLLIASIYLLTGNKNFNLNKSYNDELERQVQAIESKSNTKSKQHFNALMRWNIALSDLETTNYFIVWCGVIALFIYTPMTVIRDGVLTYGLVFSILMYVFGYIEKLTLMPLHIQQAIRLNEISQRLSM
ncbi:ABC transporter six-transmembrane domain-containing protein [Cognaticolwellia mytili]|uniref:ABC transporter six-transmembrane domain-containing protein n=1 Tax=Cognaticolwellia mytili TaxID=1888913 RepID=UPI000A177B21|nr:ABC transporter six-transmembrane domain-containing protein [Cognaticolwellia mytili]